MQGDHLGEVAGGRAGRVEHEVTDARVDVRAQARAALGRVAGDRVARDVVRLERRVVALGEVGARLLARGVAVGPHVGGQDDGGRQRVGVAAGLGSMAAHLGEVAGKAVGADHVGEPAVTEPPGPAQRRRRATTDEQRRAAGLGRRRVDLHALEAVEAPGMAGRLLRAPQRAQRSDALVGACAPLADRHTGRLEVLRPLAAHADAEQQAAAADEVDRAVRLGDPGGVA